MESRRGLLVIAPDISLNIFELEEMVSPPLPTSPLRESKGEGTRTRAGAAK